MSHTGGALTINGHHVLIAEAECDLFVGRVDIQFSNQDSSGSICNIPYADALDFNDLANREVTIADCENATYDNILFKPRFKIGNHSYAITSLHATNREHHAIKDLLLTRIAFIVAKGEDGKAIEVSGEITSKYCPMARSALIFRQQPIPIRFANHYLLLLGLPAIPNSASRGQVISVFGETESEGGGVHPRFGYIQPWIRFAIEDFYLHCRFDTDKIVEVTFMPATGPFSP